MPLQYQSTSGTEPLALAGELSAVLDLLVVPRCSSTSSISSTWKILLKTMSLRTQKIAKLMKFAAMTIERADQGVVPSGAS